VRLIAIGASAGGIEALKVVVAALPRRLPAAVAIVNHLAPESPGFLPGILARAGKLPAAHAVNNEPLLQGRLYVAPPDHHLLVRTSHVVVTQGPKENRARPAIDPLFRSAAISFGHRAIGVVLSGALDDGTAGLAAIKGCGGTAIVQDPAEAAMGSMPQSALRHVIVDHVVSLQQMGPLLAKLVEEDPPRDQREVVAIRRAIQTELNYAAGEGEGAMIKHLGAPSLFTCPECHGALVEIAGASPLRYRCHTGHAFTAANLLAALRDTTEDALWTTIRSFQESAFLLRHLAERSDHQDAALVAELERQADEAEQRSHELRRLLARDVSDEPAIAAKT
jgi:two-component system chemotaxis response regulator CheB